MPFNTRDGDTMIRLMEIRDRVNAEGPEALTDEDKAFLFWLADELKRTIESFVKIMMEFAATALSNIIAPVMEAYNALPDEVKADILKHQTPRPVDNVAIGGQISDLHINSLHDHVNIDVLGLETPNTIQRSEQQWR